MDQRSTIVAAVDGSEESLKALHWAVDQARAEHRSLTLLHALGEPANPAWMDQAVLYSPELRASVRKQGERVLDAAGREAAQRAPELEVTTECEDADVRAALLERSRTASLLVLGSRGRGHLRSLLLGSVSVAVVRHASCPVVVHRPTRHGVVRHGITVAVDATEESAPVLDFAYRQASLRDLPLTVLHCFWDVLASAAPAQLVTGSDHGTSAEQERLALAETMAGMGERYPEVRVQTEVARGMPEEVLVRLSERMDLIVVGAHQGSWARQLLLGSRSVAVVEHASCPVAVVPVPVVT